jgi:hypothetical protein
MLARIAALGLALLAPHAASAAALAPAKASDLVALSTGSGATNPDGGASGTVLAPPGVTVRAGPALCITGGDFTSAVLHGFLAKDK